VPDWLAIVVGAAVLALVWTDRRDLGSAWRSPAKWWSRDAGESADSRSPAQPLNAVLGVVLGTAAIVYGIVALIT
jgi:hypothetical protein